MAVKQASIGSLEDSVQYDDADLYSDGENHTGFRADKIRADLAPSIPEEVLRLADVGSGGAAAPANALYVVLALTGDLSAERLLTAGTGISIVDNGANSTVVVSALGAGGYWLDPVVDILSTPPI